MLRPYFVAEIVHPLLLPQHKDNTRDPPAKLAGVIAVRSTSTAQRKCLSSY